MDQQKSIRLFSGNQLKSDEQFITNDDLPEPVPVIPKTGVLQFSFIL
jgi:hypothetical protein